MTRPTWDEYFLSIAKEVATRSTCPRASVGAVIVKDNHIIAIGYNGSAPGKPHCTEVGCDIHDNHCQRAIHAETNAVAQAAKFGLPIDGATMYFYDNLLRSAKSCTKCYQIMVAAGITKVVGLHGTEFFLK